MLDVEFWDNTYFHPKKGNLNYKIVNTMMKGCFKEAGLKHVYISLCLYLCVYLTEISILQPLLKNKNPNPAHLLHRCWPTLITVVGLPPDSSTLS